MITLTHHKEAARALKNAVIGIDGIPQNDKGTVIEYHQGDWSDLIGLKPVGKMARELSDQGRVVLCQSRIGDGRFSYRAIIR